METVLPVEITKAADCVNPEYQALPTPTNAENHCRYGEIWRDWRKHLTKRRL